MMILFHFHPVFVVVYCREQACLFPTINISIIIILSNIYSIQQTNWILFFYRTYIPCNKQIGYYFFYCTNLSHTANKTPGNHPNMNIRSLRNANETNRRKTNGLNSENMNLYELYYESIK